MQAQQTPATTVTSGAAEEISPRNESAGPGPSNSIPAHLNIDEKNGNEIQPPPYETATESRQPAGDHIINVPNPQDHVVNVPNLQQLHAQPLNTLGEEPAFIDCPHCKKRTQTRVANEDSSSTHLAAAGCCLCCGIICVFLPYCFGWCQHVDHYCTACNQKVTHRPYGEQVQVLYPAPNQIGGEVAQYAQTGGNMAYPKPAQASTPAPAAAPVAAKGEAGSSAL